ncbi:MAG: hypothetical protein COB02_07300 [Candidatus Cloacimonadota bacterium]|nr:MAG: hypothetical protein COB02_07300 [Candidatus Cloacimonadota bacterium]
MKIIHTSDWHLGQRFHHLSRHEEHQDFLNYLFDYINKNKVDILIVAGDIFDTANPNREAEKLYYNFLKDIVLLNFCKVIIIGGNHDSASHLNAPKILLQSLNIHIYGELSEKLEDMILDCSTNQQALHIACIPFLKDSDIRKESSDDSYHAIEKKVRSGITNIYKKTSELMPNNSINIATGHLFALGSQLGDSERSIHVGNLGAISQEDIKQGFDYIALGHLHKPQSLKNNVHYCGSPIALSFSEAKQEKEITILDISNDTITIDKQVLPKFRSLYQLKGSISEIESQIIELSNISHNKTPWLEIKLNQQHISKESYDNLFKLCQDNNLELMKVILEQQIDLINENNFLGKDISELSPDDIFLQRLEFYDGDIDKESLKNCFSELLEKFYESQKS